MWLGAVAGPGRSPVRLGRTRRCMLSGGIDSPVAAYMVMKRGMRLDFVHFHSVPRTDPASLEKTHDLVRVLAATRAAPAWPWSPCCRSRRRSSARCPARFRVLLYRRFMLRIAERLARRFKSRALVTGESLGQVASQTIENLAAVEAVARLPILRPLISLDKQEIIDIGAQDRHLRDLDPAPLRLLLLPGARAPRHPVERRRARRGRSAARH